MSTTAPEVIAMPEQAPSVPDAREMPSCRRPAPLTPEQQVAFDRAFRKRDAKLRRELEAMQSAMRRDLLETVALTGQLLARCRDRISRQDAIAIQTGLREIEREYRLVSQTQEAKCRTEH